MNKETKYLIELTKSFLNAEKVLLRDDVDYNLIYHTALTQNLLPILFCVVNTSTNSQVVDEKIRLSMSEHFFSAVFIYEEQKKAIEEIYNIFSRNGIKHIFFKGAILKELYPSPEARLMGDIDVLISKSDERLAKSVLIRSGFACLTTNGPVTDYRKGDIHLELHTSMVGAEEKYHKAFDDALMHCEYENYCGRPNDNYHFSYLIAHIAHHFNFYGAGIKLLLDLALMIKKCNIDYDFVLNKLDEIGLKKFAKSILTICYKWYGVGKSYDIDIQKAEDFLVSFGAFGGEREHKGAVIARRQMINSKNMSPAVIKIRLLFPSYNNLKNIPYIKFICGRPWLVPFAWAYRILYNIFNRHDFLKKTVMDLDDENVTKLALLELKLFEEIGLK